MWTHGSGDRGERPESRRNSELGSPPTLASSFPTPVSPWVLVLAKVVISCRALSPHCNTRRWNQELSKAPLLCDSERAGLTPCGCELGTRIQWEPKVPVEESVPSQPSTGKPFSRNTGPMSASTSAPIPFPTPPPALSRTKTICWRKAGWEPPRWLKWKQFQLSVWISPSASSHLPNASLQLISFPTFPWRMCNLCAAIISCWSFTHLIRTWGWKGEDAHPACSPNSHWLDVFCVQSQSLNYRTTGLAEP